MTCPAPARCITGTTGRNPSHLSSVLAGCHPTHDEKDHYHHNDIIVCGAVVVKCVWLCIYMYEL